jgi:hypothetical protein
MALAEAPVPVLHFSLLLALNGKHAIGEVDVHILLPAVPTTSLSDSLISMLGQPPARLKKPLRRAERSEVEVAEDVVEHAIHLPM